LLPAEMAGELLEKVATHGQTVALDLKNQLV
jgi:hypothetical protein